MVSLRRDASDGFSLTYGRTLFEHYGDLDAVREALEDSYSGVYPSLADYKEELTAETPRFPKICATTSTGKAWPATPK